MSGVTDRLSRALSASTAIKPRDEEDARRLVELTAAAAAGYSELLALGSELEHRHSDWRKAIDAKDEAWRETNMLRAILRQFALSGEHSTIEIVDLHVEIHARVRLTAEQRESLIALWGLPPERPRVIHRSSSGE